MWEKLCPKLNLQQRGSTPVCPPRDEQPWLPAGGVRNIALNSDAATHFKYMFGPRWGLYLISETVKYRSKLHITTNGILFSQQGCAGSPRFEVQLTHLTAESAGGEPAWPDCAAFNWYVMRLKHGWQVIRLLTIAKTASLLGQPCFSRCTLL